MTEAAQYRSEDAVARSGRALITPTGGSPDRLGSVSYDVFKDTLLPAQDV
jgi:hypothetical protein